MHASTPDSGSIIVVAVLIVTQAYCTAREECTLHQHVPLYCLSVLSRLQFRNHSRYCNCCLKLLSVAGITTVLTMTFLGLEARTDLPKVPYPTALDFFVFMSFAFIFATIIQVSKLYLRSLVWEIWRPLMVACREGFQYNILVSYFRVQNLLSSQFVSENVNTIKTGILYIIWYGNGTCSLIAREDKMI